MKNYFLTCFYCFLVGLILFSCQSREEIVSEKIQEITQNMEEWDSFNSKVISGNFDRLSDAVPISVLDSVSENEAKAKGLNFIIFEKGKCENIVYSTEWNESINEILYLKWSPCADAQNEINKSWVIGNGWPIFSR